MRGEAGQGGVREGSGAAGEEAGEGSGVVEDSG